MNPQDKLRQQAAIARSAISAKRVRTVFAPTRGRAIAQSYNADLGQDIIQLSDGTTKYAEAITNGVRVGQNLSLHESRSRASIDAIASQKVKKVVPTTTRKTTYPFKVLFSITTNKTISFYVGGDRKAPSLILQLQLR